MAKNLLSKNNPYYVVAAVVVLVLAVFLLTGKGTPTTNNAVITPAPTAVQPSLAACVNGQQKEFTCVGSISGTQTYYECVNGAWASKSRYNYSECVKTFGPNETIDDVEETPANTTATVTPVTNVTAVPSMSPLPVTNASVPAFINMTVKNIRTSSADAYWFTNANATGILAYGDEPGVRRWRLDASVPAFSQFKGLLLSPGKTYYFDVETCANSTCVTSLEQNFSTPLADKYFYEGSTEHYPGDQVNYTAAQLNPK